MGFTMKPLSFLLLLLFSITLAKNQPDLKRVKLLPEYVNGIQLAVFEIDSCEYIGPRSFSNMQFLTHKGNCRFCEIRRKQHLDSINKSKVQHQFYHQ